MADPFRHTLRYVIWVLSFGHCQSTFSRIKGILVERFSRVVEQISLRRGDAWPQANLLYKYRLKVSAFLRLLAINQLPDFSSVASFRKSWLSFLDVFILMLLLTR